MTKVKSLPLALQRLAAIFVTGVLVIGGSIFAVSSPAFATVACKPYRQSGWNVYPCIDTYQGAYFRGSAGNFDTPSNCAGFKVRLVNSAGQVKGTSAMLPCERPGQEEDNVVSESISLFSGRKARVQFIAYDRNVQQILVVNTIYITG